MFANAVMVLIKRPTKSSCHYFSGKTDLNIAIAYLIFDLLWLIIKNLNP